MGGSLEFKGGAHVVGEVAEVLRIGREPRSYGNAVGESVASARRNGSGASVPAHADRDVEFLDVVRLHQASEGGVGGETTFKLLVHLVDAVVDVLHSRVLKLLQFVDFHSMAINGRADRAQFVGVAFESLAVFNNGPFGGRHAVVDCTDLLVGLGNGLLVGFNVVLVVFGALVEDLRMLLAVSNLLVELFIKVLFVKLVIILVDLVFLEVLDVEFVGFGASCRRWRVTTAKRIETRCARAYARVSALA